MENNFNQKILFYEDKENQLEKDAEKNEIIRQENNALNIKIRDLEKENEGLNLKLNLQQNTNINPNKPIKLYKSPTLIGLNNIGATYFMNSTLQCLSQTKNLTNYF